MACLLAVVVALALGVDACGGSSSGSDASETGRSGASGSTTSISAPVSGRLKGDEDDDDTPADVERHSETEKPDGDVDFDHDTAENSTKGYHDSDDAKVRGFGHRASPAVRLSLITLVDRYHAAVVADDGATACSLIFSLLAESIPEQWAQAPGPRYLRGLKTCPAVLTPLFTHLHSELAKPIRVTEARVEGKHAYVLLGSPVAPASLMEAREEAGVWKIDNVIAQALP